MHWLNMCYLASEPCTSENDSATSHLASTSLAPGPNRLASYCFATPLRMTLWTWQLDLHDPLNRRVPLATIEKSCLGSKASGQAPRVSVRAASTQRPAASSMDAERQEPQDPQDQDACREEVEEVEEVEGVHCLPASTQQTIRLLSWFHCPCHCHRRRRLAHCSITADCAKGYATTLSSSGLVPVGQLLCGPRPWYLAARALQESSMPKLEGRGQAGR